MTIPRLQTSPKYNNILHEQYVNENEINGSQNGYTLDTNVVINILKNPNISSLLTCRVNFKNSNIHLCSQTSTEAQRLDYDIDFISKRIQSTTKANVIIDRIINGLNNNAKRLEKIYPDLHDGDSQILAYAKATKTILITCDKDFAKAAKASGTKVVNPNILACDVAAKKAKSKYYRIVNAIVKPVTAKKKKFKFQKNVKKAVTKPDIEKKTKSKFQKNAKKAAVQANIAKKKKFKFQKNAKKAAVQANIAKKKKFKFQKNAKKAAVQANIAKKKKFKFQKNAKKAAVQANIAKKKKFKFQKNAKKAAVQPDTKHKVKSLNQKSRQNSWRSFN